MIFTCCQWSMIADSNFLSRSDACSYPELWDIRSSSCRRRRFFKFMEECERERYWWTRWCIRWRKQCQASYNPHKGKILFAIHYSLGMIWSWIVSASRWYTNFCTHLLEQTSRFRSICLLGENRLFGKNELFVFSQTSGKNKHCHLTHPKVLYVLEVRYNWFWSSNILSNINNSIIM